MEELIKSQLKVSTLKKTSICRGGDISKGRVYETDFGKVFIKVNNKKGSDVMFKGEFESLKAIWETKCICVPKPLCHGENYIVMEYLDLKSYKKSKELGTQLAQLHINNLNKLAKDEGAIKEFGFFSTTCCGFLPMDNNWSDDWPDFYANQRLKPHVESLNDETLNDLWSKLFPNIPLLFDGITVQPSLLHGDLWAGNVGQVDETPAIYDPAAFYGHHEFDLSIGVMFGGFDHQFYDAYHQIIPKSPGFETRSLLYQLFHNLNHWRHFGVGYRPSSLNLIRQLLKKIDHLKNYLPFIFISSIKK